MTHCYVSLFYQYLCAVVPIWRHVPYNTLLWQMKLIWIKVSLSAFLFTLWKFNGFSFNTAQHGRRWWSTNWGSHFFRGGGRVGWARCFGDLLAATIFGCDFHGVVTFGSVRYSTGIPCKTVWLVALERIAGISEQTRPQFVIFTQKSCNNRGENPRGKASTRVALHWLS